MNDEKFELIRKYLDGELDDRQEQQALLQIAVDSELRSLLRFDLRMKQSILRQQMPKESFDVPDGFSDRVITAIEAKEETDASTMLTLKNRIAGLLGILFEPRVLQWRPVSAIAMAAVLLIAVIWPVYYSGMYTGMQEEQQIPSSQIQQTADQHIDRVWMRFIYVDDEAESMAVAGDFSDWEPISLSRQQINGDVVWTGMIPLPRGEHEYMFVKNDHIWVTDPLAGYYSEDGFGNRNAVISL